MLNSEENKGGFLNKSNLLLDFSNKRILRYLINKDCPDLPHPKTWLGYFWTPIILKI